MTKRCDVAIVGGGAAGLVAATSAARRGASALICDRMPRLGKKILATGGGRCNLSNDALSPAAFTSSSRNLVASVLEKFGRDDIHGLFKGLGLETYSEQGRIFPVTNQASSVLSLLEAEVRRLRVAVELGFDAADIQKQENGFAIASGDGRRVEATSVILAGGGKSYPALGSNGSAYRLAQLFGHHIIPPVPSAVPVLVKDKLCHLLQGLKIRAKATALIADKPVQAAEGEALFTQYGLSGTAVLDVSEALSIAINRDGRTSAAIVLDLVPFLTRNALAARLLKRTKDGWPAADLAMGILPDRFAAVIPGMIPATGRNPDDTAAVLAAALKEKRLNVHGTRGWNEAEFTCGGIDAREVDPWTLESKIQKGLFFAGEILDVQGKRGGYNLAWAWSSGFVAGLGG
ncbi:MAG: aminoacetone oxidase family FAD-binding enzyme [Candidatus Aminicenantales bacterium]|jgi:predicted Rossmann fold flavoprotein